jgi:hypothetical protein
VDRPHHVSKVAHAQVESGRLPEHAVVKLSLVLLGVRGRVADRLAVLLLRVAAPHAVDRLLARQEVVRILQQHRGVANINADLVVLALLVAVSQQANLSCVRDDSLNLDAHLVLGAALLLEHHGIVHHLVVESFAFRQTAAPSKSKRH